jgi:hypothetical protein
MFKAALEELATIGEPVNRVLEVDLDGDEATLRFTICLPAAPGHVSQLLHSNIREALPRVPQFGQRNYRSREIRRV